MSHSYYKESMKSKENLKSLPSVLVMGRPNVGKSTFINKLLRKNKAITLDIPGVTRDITPHLTDWNGKSFWVLDSGGVFLSSDTHEIMQKKIEQIVLEKAKKVQKIIFIVDSSERLQPIDADIAAFLRPFESKVLLAINKVDNPEQRANAGEFYELGIDQFFPISSIHGTGIGDLLDAVVDSFSPTDMQSIETPPYKIAFVGRPNVGKSSLLNALLDEKRVLVDSIAGTTRDSVEAYYHVGEKKYIFIDTAGLRKKAKVEDGIEYYSVIRTQKAILEADLVVVMLCADEPLSDQDKKIVRQVIDSKQNMLLFVNKWDLAEKTDAVRQEWIRHAYRLFPSLQYYPFIFGSAKDKVHLGQLLDWIPIVLQNAQTRIGTSPLNQFVESVIKRHLPPAKLGQRIKIFYATQAQANPPLFVFFVNQTLTLSPSYLRFVENRIREKFPSFDGVPMEVVFKPRSKIRLSKKS